MKIYSILLVFLMGGEGFYAISTASADDTGMLTYPTENNLDLKEGTFEFWIKPCVDASRYLPANDYRGILSIFNFSTESGSAGCIYYVGGMYKPMGGISISIGSKSGKIPGVGQGILLPKDEWHHLAFVWKDKEILLYVDGKLGAKDAGRGTLLKSLDEALGVPKALISMGDKWGKAGRMVIDDLRLSAVARKPEELGFAAGELKADPFAKILDPFECDFVPDGKTRTKPAAISFGEGGCPSAACEFVPGKFGKGLAFFR